MKIQLDYNINCINKRKEIVEEICEKHSENLTNYNLEQLSNYLVFQMEKDERKEKRILTANRMATVNKRETSFEGVASKFVNNEDGMYNIIDEDKNKILSPKVEITKEDIETIPFIKQVRESIARLRSIPEKNYIVQQAIIDLSQTQYIIKDAYKKPVRLASIAPTVNFDYDWEDFLDFSDWKVVRAFLRNYTRLKTSNWGEIEKNMYWILCDFEHLADEALAKDYPKLYDIMIWKLSEMQNAEVQEAMLKKYGGAYSAEYISSLFNNKIPQIIAEQELERQLLYHYTFIEKGQWKKCNRCGEVKLLHPRFFSTNGTNSKTGFYSICRKCRNTKREGA